MQQEPKASGGVAAQREVSAADSDSQTQSTELVYSISQERAGNAQQQERGTGMCYRSFVNFVTLFFTIRACGAAKLTYLDLPML